MSEIVAVKIETYVLPPHEADGGDSRMLQNVDKFLPDLKYRHISTRLYGVASKITAIIINCTCTKL
jgi:hypothetical protein